MSHKALQGTEGDRPGGLNWKEQPQRVKFRAEQAPRWPLPLADSPQLGLHCSNARCSHGISPMGGVWSSPTRSGEAEPVPNSSSRAVGKCPCHRACRQQGTRDAAACKQ